MKDKLRILLGNRTFSLLAGSETWTYTLALQLKKLGHEVHGFSPDLGKVALDLEKEGIPCFNNLSTSGVKPFSFVLEKEYDHDYDVIISNHWHIVEYLRSQYPKTPIISTIHGIIHKVNDGTGNEVQAPEHPSMNGGVSQFVAVSEEVKDKLLHDYNIDSFIVRNFFDLKQFKTKKKISQTPKQIMLNSSYLLSDDPAVAVIKEVVKHYGAKLAAVGQNFTMSTDIQKVVESSDIVVGLGRSVLEGVAMGRLGIVHGHWGTGGVIHEGNVEELRSCNFSGRNSGGVMMTAEEMIAEIDKHYNEKTAEWGKDYVAKEHNVVLAADLYVQTARELLGQNIAKVEEAPVKKLKRQKDVESTGN